ncbi:transmembrane protein, putative (macronuclear) [Tetrahymena thermophila SB210]|uniref:Transmembrane protein, putative n=1 Tax=Tetrahymena thermophila (strain SB210) TaxID=312017 RepID=Q236L7_TETTS|nr:transmembrane protein, putative [Tetrahymena thermophila SB210]EAR92483.3 transmembrane protein, putative [Tetrahymena thermophila SB210]|eukprot:XP_001012728.3 transmembrane protein, putative [Tetrahymena thermophila SB210]
MIELQKKEFKYLLLVYIIISKISIILQIFQYLQLYNQLDKFVYLSDKAFVVIFFLNRYASAIFLVRIFQIKWIKALCLVSFFLEDIYYFRGLKYELEEQQNEEIIIYQNLLNGINEEDFQTKYAKLFKLLLLSNNILIPAKIISFIWSIDNETLETNFIGLYVIISFAIDQYIFWMDGLFYLNYLIHLDAAGLPQVLIQETLITSINFLACVAIFIQNMRLEYFFWLYLIFNMLLIYNYYKSIRSRAIYSQMYFLIYALIIKMLCHVDVECKIVIANYESIGSLTLNKTIKFSIIQKLVLYLFFSLNLYQSNKINYYQQGLIILAITTIAVQVIRFCCNIDILNFRNPYKIEIDNFYDLKRCMVEYENQSNQNGFYKNLQTVEIYIAYEDFVNESDLINCLLCAFGKSEINSSAYQRKNLAQSNSYQKIRILNYIHADSFEIGLQNCKILPQIVQLEAYLTHIKQYQFAKCLLQNNCILWLTNLDIDLNQNMSVLWRQNQYILQILTTQMQIIAYNQNISIEQTFNPQIIFYDIYV